MKRLGWILVLLMAASPAWATKKVNIQQLKDLLVSLQQAKKSDADVATELEQIQLTEQLTRGTMNALNSYIPGPFSTEQFFVLEAGSAALPPPSADLPATPAPDATTQKAILDKAVDYVTKSYAQLPHLAGTKSTFRFQDNMETGQPAPQAQAGAKPVPPAVDPSQIVHFFGSIETPLDFANGGETVIVSKEKLQDHSGQINLLGQGPVLSSVLQEAQAAGPLNWLRWETVNGSQVAVFSFAVDKKKSHYAVNYCCFSATPVGGTDAMSRGNYGARGGVSTDSTTSTASISGMGAAFNNGMPRLPGTDWKGYKGTVPYHGELFVDPATGVVVRLVTVAEFKSNDLVQLENQRIDYSPTQVDGKTLVLPFKAFINTEEVPNGYAGYGKHPNRHTLFTIDYKDYKAAGGAPAEHK
jgi:hypothetical protein